MTSRRLRVRLFVCLVFVGGRERERKWKTRLTVSALNRSFSPSFPPPPPPSPRHAVRRREPGLDHGVARVAGLVRPPRSARACCVCEEREREGRVRSVRRRRKPPVGFWSREREGASGEEEKNAPHAPQNPEKGQLTRRAHDVVRPGVEVRRQRGQRGRDCLDDAGVLRRRHFLVGRHLLSFFAFVCFFVDCVRARRVGETGEEGALDDVLLAWRVVGKGAGEGAGEESPLMRRFFEPPSS